MKALMSPDTIFTVSCLFSGLGWLALLILSPYWRNYDKFVIGIVAAVLALVYTSLNFANFSMGIIQGFSSLEGVAGLFENKYLLMACWAHILVFDLIGATWIKKNSAKHGISHLAVIPALIFTCIFGPFGILIYLATRWIKTGKYFADNF